MEVIQVSLVHNKNQNPTVPGAVARATSAVVVVDGSQLFGGVWMLPDRGAWGELEGGQLWCGLVDDPE